jgi:hypothetical protein
VFAADVVDQTVAVDEVAGVDEEDVGVVDAGCGAVEQTPGDVGSEADEEGGEEACEALAAEADRRSG